MPLEYVVSELINPDDDHSPRCVLEGSCPNCGPFIEPRQEATLDFEHMGTMTSRRFVYCYGCEWWWSATVLDGEATAFRYSDATMRRFGRDFTSDVHKSPGGDE